MPIRIQFHHRSLPDPPPASPFLCKSSQNHHFLPYPLKMMVPYIKPYQTYIKSDNVWCFFDVPYSKPISNQHLASPQHLSLPWELPIQRHVKTNHPTHCRGTITQLLKTIIMIITTLDNNYHSHSKNSTSLLSLSTPCFFEDSSFF